MTQKNFLSFVRTTLFHPWTVPLLVGVVVCFSHIHQGTLAVDAIRYAQLGKQLLESGDVTSLTDPYRGTPYANKPPLLFAMLALVMGSVGFGTFVIKFPAALFVFAALLVFWSIARRASETAALWTIVLIIINRSFARDLVELGFDGIALCGAGLAFLGAVRLFERGATRIVDAILIGLGFFLLLQSKPPYVLLVAGPMALAVFVSGRVREILRAPAWLAAMLAPICLALSWFVFSGLHYVERALDNQVGTTFELPRGFIANFLAWCKSMAISLSPLSLVGILASGVALKSQVAARFRDPAKVMFISCMLLFMPIMLTVALRPRYMWIPLSAGAVLGGQYLAERFTRVSANHLRFALCGVSALFLALVFVFGVSLHRGSEVVLALRTVPELVKDDTLIACVGNRDPVEEARAVQQTGLLLDLEFGREIPIYSPGTIPPTWQLVVADKHCAEQVATPDGVREKIGKAVVLRRGN